jgi:hypothetical protein
VTDRIEAAAAELRPLLQEFILWAPKHAPDSDPELLGSAALWHRLSVRDDVHVWRKGDLRTLLLDRLPKVIEDPDAAADGMVPTLRAYLTFLSTSGRLRRGSDPLAALLAELDALEDDFVAAMEDLIAEGDWDDDELDEEDEPGDLGDFEPFAEALAGLPPVRVRPDAELAAAARAVPLIARARDLALWAGADRRRVRRDPPADGPELADALAAAGLPRPADGAAVPAEHERELWNLWEHAFDLEFLVADRRGRVTLAEDTADWPFDDDEDVLELWVQGLRSVDYGDPELDDDDLTDALAGLTRGVLVRLLAAGGARPADELRAELAEAAADLDDLGEDAWAAAAERYGDPLAPALGWLAGYGMVERVTDGGAETVRLTPLGVEGVLHLADEAGIEVDARPAFDVMSAAELLEICVDLPDEEADAEFTAWLETRDPERAAKELLDAAAADESNEMVRVQAASMVGSLGEAAVPAWRSVLDERSLRPYATNCLARLGVPDAPKPGPEDVQWMVLDMWAISAGLGRREFVNTLRDVGTVRDLLGLLDTIWKVPHPHLPELLETIADAHPDKRVSKAARRALFKARSAAAAR